MSILSNLPKNWWASKAIWGGIVMAIAFVLQFFHVNLDEATKDTLINHLVGVAEPIGGLIGFVMVIWGRVTAKHPIATPSNPAVTSP